MDATSVKSKYIASQPSVLDDALTSLVRSSKAKPIPKALFNLKNQPKKGDSPIPPPRRLPLNPTPRVFSPSSRSTTPALTLRKDPISFTTITSSIFASSGQSMIHRTVTLSTKEE